MAATTQQQLDAVNDAIARGVTRYMNPADGTMVEYPSLEALLKAKTQLEAAVATEAEGTGYLDMGVGRGGFG